MIPRPIAFEKLQNSHLLRPKSTRQMAENPEMTLSAGKVLGFDQDRMVMRFSMMSGTREISCAISSSAMDDLEGGKMSKADQREEQFMRLRDQIERCASQKFLAGELEGSPGRVILRAMDFRATTVPSRR